MQAELRKGCQKCGAFHTIQDTKEIKTETKTINEHTGLKRKYYYITCMICETRIELFNEQV